MSTELENTEVELWDLYDENHELTGKDHIRGQKVPQGYYHLVTNVWIRNKKGEYLISQRAADRYSYPLKWECTGGSVLKGEDSLTAALRETKEEIGLELSRKDAKLINSVVGRVVNGKRFYDIVDVWLFEYDGEIPLKEATTKEVAQIAWASKDKIKEMFISGELVDALGYFFEEKKL